MMASKKDTLHEDIHRKVGFRFKEVIYGHYTLTMIEMGMY